MIMRFPSGVEGRGTATLVEKNCLITAGHCLYDKDEGGLATKASVYFGRNGKLFLKKAEIEKFIVHPEYLENDENYDFAVAKLNEDVGHDLGWASLSVLKEEELKGKLVNGTGYPGTKGFFRTMLNLPSYHMYSMDGPIVSARKHKVYYHVDTSGGQSGSGAWVLDADEIVKCIAIHTTGKSPKEEGNGAVRINQENFGIIIDWMKKLNVSLM